MPHAIRVAASSAPGFAPFAELVLEVFWATADGHVAERLAAAPVVDGVAAFEAPPPPPGLLWALRVRDSATPGAAVFRSGPLGRLPGGRRGFRRGDRIEILRGGASFGLESPDGLTSILRQRLVDMPPPLSFAGLELGADADGRYLLRVRGRMPEGDRLLPFIYTRRMRLAGALDPGRPERAVVAWPEGPVDLRGARLGVLARELDRTLAEAVEAQLAGVALRVAQLTSLVGGAGAVSTTSSVSGIDLRVPAAADVPATITLCAGAITGAAVAGRPLEPSAAADQSSQSRSSARSA